MSVAAADVFLSYNRADEEAVHQIQSRLKEAGLTTFLDRYALPAGQEWQPWLETALAGCRALAIFLGPSSLGRWQHREIQLGLDRQATVEKAAPFPVIPVLLPGLQKDDIPLGRFLGLNTWIDLRQGLDEPEALQRLVAGAQGQAIDGVAADHLLAGVCPYRGLLPFREQDAGLFFGRTRFVDELVAKVCQCTAANTVAVVGRSGSGKSSVVYAGLFPALRREKGLGEQAVWDILSLRPLAEPLHQLARAFVPALHNADPITARVTLNEHADRFRKRKLTVAELDRETLRQREHIRARQRQWEEQGKDPTLLLSPGLPLEEGRKLLADHGDVLIEEAQSYIAASLAADEERQRQAKAAHRRRVRVARFVAATMAVLLLVAVAFGSSAWWQRREAQALLRLTIENAKGFVNKAVEVSDKHGVPRSVTDDGVVCFGLLHAESAEMARSNGARGMAVASAFGSSIRRTVSLGCVLHQGCETSVCIVHAA